MEVACIYHPVSKKPHDATTFSFHRHIFIDGIFVIVAIELLLCCVPLRKRIKKKYVYRHMSFSATSWRSIVGTQRIEEEEKKQSESSRFWTRFPLRGQYMRFQFSIKKSKDFRSFCFFFLANVSIWLCFFSLYFSHTLHSSNKKQHITANLCLC